MALIDFQTLTDALTRDDSGQLTTGDRDNAIADAVRRYSKDRPRRKKQDVVAAAAQLIELPSGWEENFSQVRSIEYPIGSVPPIIVSQERHGLYDTPSDGIKIALLDGVNVGDSLRVEYTIAHVLNGSTDTIASGDLEAVSCWAAALLLDQLAAHFAGASDSTIQADAVEHGSKSRDYAARAGSLRKRYLNELGLDDKKTVAAGAVVNLDQGDSQGRDRLTHPNRHR